MFGNYRNDLWLENKINDSGNSQYNQYNKNNNNDKYDFKQFSHRSKFDKNYRVKYMFLAYMEIINGLYANKLFFVLQ